MGITMGIMVYFLLRGKCRISIINRINPKPYKPYYEPYNPYNPYISYYGSCRICIINPKP